MRTRTGQCALGSDIASVIFGIDGVVIDSAQTCASAWKSVFDPFLRTYAATHETTFMPFDVRADYLHSMEGKPRLVAARDFLASRDISLPYDDLRGLTTRQEEFFLAEIRRHGVTPCTSAVAFIRETHRRGIRTAAVSAQCHGVETLRKAGMAAMFDIVLDALDASGTAIPAHPDTPLFLQAALRLGTPPSRTAVVENTAAAVAAARRGGFGIVVGIDPLGRSALREHGADFVLRDLSELRLRGRRHAA